MIYILNFLFTQKTESAWANRSFVWISLLFALSPFSANAQQSTYYKCPEQQYPFVGKPETTACEKYPDFNCETEIGEGTTFPNASSIGTSITGNVCITGDFEVDKPFAFQDAIVKIKPGVTIKVTGSPNGYDAGSWLSIEKSTLFACDGLWVGIRLGFLSGISTSKSSEIDDAEIAIRAEGLTALYIQQTVFDRNRVGIELNTPFPSFVSPGPLVWAFSNNRFACTAPLNGTTDEITEAGVKLINSSLFTFQSGLNRFYDLKYGIYSEGDYSFLGGSSIYMLRIRKDAIYMKQGAMNLKNSWLYTCGEKGINIETAKTVNVQNVQILPATTATSDYRTGIYIAKFGVNADVQLSAIHFGADMEGTMNQIRGIHLKGGDIGAGTKIRISGNSTFSFRARGSQGIYLDGVFPSSCTTEIWGNSFKVSNIAGQSGSRPSGIETDGGNKNNLSIKWNTFTSYVNIPPPPPPLVTIPQWNQGIWLRNNTAGTNNEVSVNGFNYEVQTLQNGLLVHNFQNTTYCSNVFSGFGFATGADFAGVCTGTDFTANNFEFAGSQSLNIEENTQIGIQANNDGTNKGNEWHNFFGFEPLDHARCQGDPSINKFIVHTPQSTCANESNPCFFKYHPRKITPDVNNEFFDIDPNTTPSEGCNTAFNGPGTDELDKRIANGQFTSPLDAPSTTWRLQRYLYQKFSYNPGLLAQNAAFPGFMSNKANTSVGRLYNVHHAFEQALLASNNVDQQSEQALASIAALVEDMADIDAQIEQQGPTQQLIEDKQELLSQIVEQQADYKTANDTYRSNRSTNLQTAYNLNQNVPVTYDYEINEKAVNQVYFLSLMNQGGELTEAQVSTLKNIAAQSPASGGPAVSMALGLLEDCIRYGLQSGRVAPQKEMYADADYFATGRMSQSLRTDDDEITVFPNPSNGSFTLRNLPGKAGMLVLIDLTGKIQIQQRVSGQELKIEMDADTPPGVYLLKLLLDDGSIFVEKLIFQKN